jgi:antagonist of KipI
MVDLGRPKSRRFGVPVGGPADRFSLALGNALLGNLPNTPALEVCLAGPTLQAEGDVACVVYGAPFELIHPRRFLSVGKTFTLKDGEVLRIGGTSERMRAYLCVRGGFEAKEVLGSRTAFKPIAPGDELPCQADVIQARFVQTSYAWNQEPQTLRVLDGPQANWLNSDQFYLQEFLVTSESNRMGLRLRGEPLKMPPQELVSEPVCPGSVQVTSNGQCIILGVDGQTIGGYPKIGQVVSADLDKVGQLRPEVVIRFQRVSLEEAVQLYREKLAELQEWVTRLRAADGLLL